VLRPLSKFTIGGWGGMDVGKARKADSIFEPGLVLRHMYDFGTTSETDIKVVDARQGKPTSKHPIALLARNVMPEALCQECGQPAKWLCIECLYEENKTHLCDVHAEEHPHEITASDAVVHSRVYRDVRLRGRLSRLIERLAALCFGQRTTVFPSIRSRKRS
jgi:hypothetical protein